MSAERSSCAYCNAVTHVCFWGPRPHAKWKRPVLLVASGVFAVGIPIVLVMTWKGATAGALTILLLGALVFAASSLGALVALTGCDACVARILGDF
jgi:hypothetical protein